MPTNGSGETGGERTTATPKSQLLGRRSYLRATAGAIAAVGTVSGLVAGVSEQEDASLDAVDDLGCDPNGEQPVQQIVTDALNTGESVYFPDGQYLVDGAIVVEGTDNVGLFGAEDAEFVVGDFYGDIIHVRDSTGFRLDGLEINQEVTNNAGNINVVADDWEISNVTVYGDERNPQSGGDGGHKFNVQVESPDSTGVIRDCTVLGYTDLGRYRDVTGGIRAGPSHYGTLYVENTYVEGRGNNGAYASRTNGPVIFKNCHHRNSNGAQFRIGHPDSRVENCVASFDGRDLPQWVSGGEDANWRGLRAESDNRFDHGHAGLQFLETDVIVEHGGGFPVHSGIQIQKRWGGATIDGCRIEMNADANAITIDDVDWDEVSSDDTAVTVRDTNVVGDASGGSPVYVGSGRDGTTIENCCLTASDIEANSEVSTEGTSVDRSCDSSR